jgi:phosphatidylglycerol:prolipoprotein diacylglycerol transferase
MWTDTLNPIALSIGSFSIRWYGIAYALSFILGYLWLAKLAKKKLVNLTLAEIDSLMFAVILGVIVGGRLGDFLFYDIQVFWQNPLQILRVWEGGMSFHGGLAGVLLAVVWFARKYKKHFLEITDLLTIPTTIGLFFGRIANFVNGELWGKPTDGSWGVIFPRADNLPRYPSQLFEATKNVIIGAALILTFQMKPKRGILSFLFLTLYGVGRVTVELLWRESLDGFIAGIPSGAFWSIPVLVTGVIGLVWIWKKK